LSSRTINRPWTSPLVVLVVPYIWGLIYTICIYYIVLLGLSQQEMQRLEQLRMLNQQQLSLMQLRRLEQNQLLLEHRPHAFMLPPAHPLDLQACAPAAAAARKRGRVAGREGGAAGNRKGGEGTGRVAMEAAAAAGRER
jgi:hypothetical protein